MTTVSVIIPVYNGEAFVAQSLEGVFTQTFQDFEVIVINDGSTDGTEDRISKYGNRIRYFNQENRGQSAARRTGINAAHGKLVAFLDADDVWLPRKLECQVEAARRHPDSGIITTDVLSFRDCRTITDSLKRWYKPASGNVLENLLFGNWIPPSAAMVRRDCLDDIVERPVPPPEYGEDWVMWIQIAARYPVHFIDEVLVRRRLHSGNVSVQDEEKQFQCVLRNFEIIRELVPRLSGPPNLINEAIFRVCLNRGLRDIRGVRLAEAREKLRRAVAYKPLSVKARAALAAAHTPRWVFGGAKALLKGKRQFRPATLP